MDSFEQALALILLATALNVVARRLPWPEPITYVAGGCAFGFVPGFHRVRLDPDFFFICFLPPLLFSDGWLMPLREFAKAKRPILILSIGLVVFTTVIVGLVAHALIPGLPLAMAFALGAVVSPTDAVAVSAITERLKIPTRLNIVLSGESLMNDATGLVAFKFALAALLAGTFSIWAATLNFMLVAAGGLAIGLAVGYGVGYLRSWLIRVKGADSLTEITWSLLTPYAAYIAGDAAGVSGVLAVVAAGLYSGWRDPVQMDAETRQTAWSVWSILLFWLNGLAFVLLGLQFPHLLRAVSGAYALRQLIVFAVAVSAAAMLARLAWVFPGAYLPFLFSRRVRHTEARPPWQAVVVLGWAGLRGAVTLAAALSIPLTLRDGSPLPGRDLVIFLSFCVIVSTLLIQGTTLEWLIHRLGLRPDNTLVAEERLARLTAVEAGLETLRELEALTATAEEIAALGYVIAEYEQRLATLGAEGESRTHARRRRAAEKRYRFAALEAERRAINALWRQETIADEVHRPLQNLLDYEEGMLRALPAETEGV